jgi:hypothetical protein
MVKGRTNLTRVDIEGNIVNHKYSSEINGCCHANREQKKKVALPEYQKELGRLLQNAEVSDWNHGLRKISEFNSQIQ